MTETLEEVAINDDGYPRVSEICLNHILGLNQLSQEQLQRLMGIGDHDKYKFCSGCKRDWKNQYCQDYNSYFLIEGIHT